MSSSLCGQSCQSVDIDISVNNYFFYFLSRRVTWDDKNESSFCRFRFKSQDDDGGQASRLLSFQDYPERKKECLKEQEPSNGKEEEG